jgi:flagellar protein FliS
MSGYDNYARMDIQTADPRAVIVLLYDGAVKFLNEAIKAGRDGRRMEVSNNLNRTLKIIQFLRNALDFDQGGEVADNLFKLYAYMRDTLLQANLTCDEEKIQEVLGLFKTLLEAWREVSKDPQAAVALESRQPGQPEAAPAQDPGENQPQQEETAPNAKSAGPVEVGETYAPSTGGGAAPPPHDTKPVAPAAAASPDAAIAGRSAYGIRQAG